VRTDELPARTRTALANFLRDLDRWRARPRPAPCPPAETILEESGYTDALRLDKGPTSQTRLENLKELVQSMGAFDTLEAYLEHVSLVMDLDRGAGDDAVQIMTLHSAKGLEFPLVFLPGWEEGVFPSQRSMDENGEKGLEEERRLAYVGITRAREEARISFAANRQVYGRWTSQLPSRFVDEMPVASVEAASETGYYGGGPGMREANSRWDEAALRLRLRQPGWKRAQARNYRGGPAGAPR
jgi:DNA helicase-2/ATP-dependent DNA helicase PcrA